MVSGLLCTVLCSWGRNRRIGHTISRCWKVWSYTSAGYIFSGAIELLFKSFLGENPTKLDSRLQGSLVGIIEFTAASFGGVGIIPRTDSFKAKYIRFIIDGSIYIACDRECYNRDNIIWIISFLSLSCEREKLRGSYDGLKEATVYDHKRQGFPFFILSIIK